MTQHHQILLIICYGWLSAGPLMLRHDFHFCLTSYYAISDVLSPITNNSYTNATSCFKTIQRNLLWLNCHKLSLDQAKTPIIYIWHCFNHTTSTPGSISRHIFEIKWSYLINNGQFLDFLQKSAPYDVILGQSWTYVMYKEEILCQQHLISTPPLSGSASTSVYDKFCSYL